MKPTVPIKALSGTEPHESWGGWANFLNSCEVRDQYRGVTFYGQTNCNYIVFPDGTMVQNYGYHGQALMKSIREKGVKKVKQEILDIQLEFLELKKKLLALTH